MSGDYDNGRQFTSPATILQQLYYFNQRIQKFAPDVPGWQQVNTNGFGDQ